MSAVTPTTPPAGPLLEISGLKKWFGGATSFIGGAKPAVQAVNEVSFAVERGQVVGLVGESGSGKTTVGHCILRLHRPDAGQILFDGSDIAQLDRQAMRPFRRRIQMVFQDPYSSLNPSATVGASLAEPLEIYKIGANRKERTDIVAELMRRVGLRPELAQRYPHEFSGGQRQRIGIARALAVEPELVVADEPVSALDVSVQAQVLELLRELKETLGLTMMMIAHDLAVVRYATDVVVVMYLGRIVEIAPTQELFRAPAHPYTRALLSAAPRLDRQHGAQRTVLKGELPSPANPPSGCVFRTRCPSVIKACADIVPPLIDIGGGRRSACIVEHPV